MITERIMELDKRQDMQKWHTFVVCHFYNYLGVSPKPLTKKINTTKNQCLREFFSLSGKDLQRETPLYPIILKNILINAKNPFIKCIKWEYQVDLILYSDGNQGVMKVQKCT